MILFKEIRLYKEKHKEEYALKEKYLDKPVELKVKKDYLIRCILRYITDPDLNEYKLRRLNKHSLVGIVKKLLEEHYQEEGDDK
jgi:hypothetical protein